MASIRKTKKRLKRQIAELWEDFRAVNKMALNPIGKAHLKDSIYQHIQMLEQELSNLSLKRKKVTILTQSDFIKDLDPTMHDVMADENMPMLTILKSPKGKVEPIPFTNLWKNKDDGINN